MVNWGKSLPVPNIQALAAAESGEVDIPERYIRPETEFDEVARSGESGKLPVIDLELLLHPELCHEENLKLDQACREWGFFQLINHGIPSELIEKLKADTGAFFSLPLEEKLSFSQLSGGIEGYGHLNVSSQEQKLDWGDMLALFTRPITKRNMRIWPTNPPTFRDTVDKYSAAINGVASHLFRSMAKNLTLEDSECLVNIFIEKLQAMRFSVYPPCPKSTKVLGLSPHSDASGLTLLLQVNDINGLQIKKNAKWFTIEPLPNAFIVNVGDMLEIFTNGKYKSIEHRVVINPKEERLSIAAFQLCNDDITIGPLQEIAKVEVERYKRLSRDEYMKAYMSAKLDGKNILEQMKIKE